MTHGNKMFKILNKTFNNTKQGIMPCFFFYIGSNGSKILGGFHLQYFLIIILITEKYQNEKKCEILVPISFSPYSIRAEVAPKVSPLIGSIFLKFKPALIL